MNNEETKNTERTKCNSKYACVIVGVTGSGKSSTGNSILGEKCFASSDRGESETSESVCKHRVSYGFDITVVDTPGVLDTPVSVKEAWEKSCMELVNALEMCPSDVKRCLILVLKYPCSATDFDKESLNILRCVLGPDFINKFCVIVLTCGESFYAINKEKTIDDWCREIKGALGDLFKECNYRIVLFSNKDKSPTTKQNQVEKLMQVIGSLPHSYTQEHFNLAKSQHKRKLLLSKLPELQLHFSSRLDNVERNIMTIRGNYDNMSNEIDAISRDIKIQEEGVFYEVNEESMFQELYNQSALIAWKIFVLSEKRKTDNALIELQENIIRDKDEYHQLATHQEGISKIKETIEEFISELSTMGVNVNWENLDKFYFNLVGYFQNLESKIEQLEKQIRDMKDAIMQKEQTIPVERHILSLFRRYDNAPDSEFKAKTVRQIKLEAKQLHDSIKDDVKMCKFAAKLTTLIGLCEEKAEKTDSRFKNLVAEGVVNGLLTVAGGALGGLELLSSRLGVIIAAKAGPAGCNMVKSVFKTVYSLCKENQSCSERSAAGAADPDADPEEAPNVVEQTL